MGWEIFFTEPIISFLSTIIIIDAGFVVLRLSYNRANADDNYDQLHEFDKVVYSTLIGVIMLFPLSLMLPTPPEGYSLFRYISENLTLTTLFVWAVSGAMEIYIISRIILSLLVGERQIELELEEIKQPSKILLGMKWITDKLKKLKNK